MFTGISCDDPFLISDIGILYPLSFLVNMEDLINFIELFKEPAFDFFDFLYYFALSFSLISILIFTTSFFMLVWI